MDLKKKKDSIFKILKRELPYYPVGILTAIVGRRDICTALVTEVSSTIAREYKVSADGG